MTSQGAFWEPEKQSRGFMLPSATVEWSTPLWLFDPMNAEFRFTVDVAASHEHHRCERYYTKEDNGLAQDWRGERVWCNPPYNAEALQAFTQKAWETTREDPSSLAVFLVPVKSDQKWWHRYAIKSEVRFIPGRVAFGGAANSAPMPVTFVIISHKHGPAMLSFEGSQAELFDDS